MAYFSDIYTTIKTLSQGLGLTWKHLRQALSLPRRDTTPTSSAQYFAKDAGIVTLQYPFEQFPVPDHGRYQLHNEIDDCIVCDKCAKICPVNCIDIEAIKATEQIGTTSDGTPVRLYAARFDIDMAKCCFCGLCTTVCPTECLTMTSEYDFSTFSLADMNFPFSKMTESEIESARKEAEQAKAAKVKPPTEKPPAVPDTEKAVKPATPRPVFKRASAPKPPETSGE
jgi:NADH-quinone oxidoreductase subunit I